MIKSLLLSFTAMLLTISLFAPIAYGQAVVNPCPGPNCKPNTFDKGANAINLGNQFGGSGLGIQPPAAGGIVGTIVKNVLSLLFVVGGIGAVIYFVWGAVDWILSGGDKEKVGNARKKMTHAIIGLVLLSLSYFLLQLVGEIIGFNPLQPIQIRSLGEQ